MYMIKSGTTGAAFYRAGNNAADVVPLKIQTKAVAQLFAYKRLLTFFSFWYKISTDCFFEVYL